VQPVAETSIYRQNSRPASRAHQTGQSTFIAAVFSSRSRQSYIPTAWHARNRIAKWTPVKPEFTLKHKHKHA
jgi:hypothetical protein